MPDYLVQIPVTGIIAVSVTAESEEDAISEAMEREFSNIDITEFEVTEHVTEGNVCNAVLNDAVAELEEDDEAESKVE